MKRIEGFREWLPEETRSRRDTETCLRELMKDSGYLEVRVPLVTPAGDARGYRLLGHEGSVGALRSDFTRPVAAMASGSLADRPRPLRLCYAGPVFRPSQPHTDTPGESWQLGAEVFGSHAPEQELVSLATAGVERVTGSGVTVVAGDISLTTLILQRAGLDDAGRDRAFSLLRGRNMVDLEAYLAGPGSGGALVQELMELLMYAGSAREVERRWVEAGGGAGELEPLSGLLWGPGTRPVFTLGLAPDLPYYTGLVFEVYVAGHPQPVARGGRCDMLTRGGTGESAAGFAWDLDSLLPVACSGMRGAVHASIH